MATVKKDDYSSPDQIRGKAERRAKKALYEYITGCDFGDADEQSGPVEDVEYKDVTHEVETEIQNNANTGGTLDFGQAETNGTKQPLKTPLDSNMKVIFGIAILTAKDIDAMNARINKAADMAKENEQSVAQQDKALIRFSGKFATAMDFIGRNLPLKRKRKAFRKIVEA